MPRQFPETGQEYASILLGCAVSGVVAVKQTDLEVSDDDIFEIVYTSGTTSEPKGVVITNRNIVSNIRHCREFWPQDRHSRFLSVLPMSHIFEQVAGFFYPLRFGCRIAYLYSRKSSAIVEALQQERVTMMATVPVFLQLEHRPAQ